MSENGPIGVTSFRIGHLLLPIKNLLCILFQTEDLVVQKKTSVFEKSKPAASATSAAPAAAPAPEVDLKKLTVRIFFDDSFLR